MRPVAAMLLIACELVFGGLTLRPAAADGCDGPVLSNGICLSGESPGEPDKSNPSTVAHQGGGQGCRDSVGAQVPCTNDLGFVWLTSHGCYGFMLEPQPPAGSPLWRGHKPSEGSVWSCDPTVAIPENTWFVPGAAPVVDAGSVAQDILRRAPFETANASVAPPPRYHTYVNYKNWMWIPATQWHDVSVSMDAGGAQVTLSAVPTRVEWDMGLDSVNCPGPGRAWADGMAENAPTSCAFTYTTMDNPRGDTWPISARIVYSVRWTCSGRCSSPDGYLGEHAAMAGTTTTIRVLQRQTVVTG